MSQLFLGPGPNTDEFNTVKSDIGIVEETNTATHNITKGQYVIWKNGLYTASAAISVGNTLSLSNLTAVSNGIANVLNDQIATKHTKVEPSGGLSYNPIHFYQIAGILQIYIIGLNLPAGSSTICQMPPGYVAKYYYYDTWVNGTMLRFTTYGGSLSVYNYGEAINSNNIYITLLF